MLKTKRLAKHKTVRKKISGTETRPRVAIFRSSAHIYAQCIDDSKSITIASESDLSIKSGTKKEKAEKVGASLAKKILDKKVDSIIFDRGGFHYHGRVASLAEGLRKGGIKF